MRTVSIRLSDALFRRAKALAARDGISFSQLVALALAERVSTALIEDDRAADAVRYGDDIRTLFPGITWADDGPDASSGERSES